MNYSLFDSPQSRLAKRDVSGIGDRRLFGHVTPQSLYITTLFSLLTLVTLFLIKCNKGNKNKEGEKRKVIREFIKGKLLAGRPMKQLLTATKRKRGVSRFLRLIENTRSPVDCFGQCRNMMREVAV